MLLYFSGLERHLSLLEFMNLFEFECWESVNKRAKVRKSFLEKEALYSFY